MTPSSGDAARRSTGGSGTEAVRAHEAALAESELAQTRRRFRAACLFGCFLYPFFTVQDIVAKWTVVPEVPWASLLLPRAVGTCIIILGTVIVFRWERIPFRAMVVLDQILYTQTAVTVVLIGLHVGGLGSLYLPGNCLVLAARMFSLPYSWKQGLIANVLPALSGPLVLAAGVALDERLRRQLHDLDQLIRFGIHTVYLLSMAVCMSVAGHVVAKLRTQLASDRSIGKYKLRRRIGLGGMGEVWAAFHTGLRRDVALKLLRAERDSAVATQRFEREVRATSELTHPNTVRVFDYGATDDGLLFYAMELLQGQTLHEVVTKEGRLPPARAVFLVAQAARALAEAHERGIIHRDVKPENLFITTAGGEQDFVKILDFGIARIGSTEGDEKLTADDTVLGTLAYLAPEAAKGQAPTPLVDVYGSGAVLHFALTGHAPVEAESKLVLLQRLTSDDETVVSMEHGSPALQALLRRALSKQPSERPRGALAFANDLAALPEHGQWVPGRGPVNVLPIGLEPAATGSLSSRAMETEDLRPVEPRT